MKRFAVRVFGNSANLCVPKHDTSKFKQHAETVNFNENECYVIFDVYNPEAFDKFFDAWNLAQERQILSAEICVWFNRKPTKSVVSKIESLGVKNSNLKTLLSPFSNEARWMVPWSKKEEVGKILDAWTACTRYTWED
jgi:hypothetical protein